MSSTAIVPVRPSAPAPSSLTIETTPARTPAPDLHVAAIVYVSLALAIYVVVRGDTAQVALLLPYLAGMLQILVRRPG